MKFRDHFSKQAQAYSLYRPHYPPELIEYLSTLTGEHELAWDCATGNGQVARVLADYFRCVKASDASVEQIARAVPHSRVEYSVGRAEEPRLAARSVDLITIAQALHWFQRDLFYAQVRRVLKPSGLIAAWCYGLCFVNERIDRVVGRLYEDILGDYWPEGRLLVEHLYASMDFPFPAISAPEFAMRAEWGCTEFMGYLSSWSAAQRYQEQNGADPLTLVQPELEACWGEEVRTVTWPLGLLLGRTG